MIALGVGKSFSSTWSGGEKEFMVVFLACWYRWRSGDDDGGSGEGGRGVRESGWLVLRANTTTLGRGCTRQIKQGVDRYHLLVARETKK